MEELYEILCSYLNNVLDCDVDLVDNVIEFNVYIKYFAEFTCEFNYNKNSFTVECEMSEEQFCNLYGIDGEMDYHDEQMLEKWNSYEDFNNPYKALSCLTKQIKIINRQASKIGIKIDQNIVELCNKLSD